MAFGKDFEIAKTYCDKLLCRKGLSMTCQNWHTTLKIFFALRPSFTKAIVFLHTFTIVLSFRKTTRMSSLSLRFVSLSFIRDVATIGYILPRRFFLLSFVASWLCTTIRHNPDSDILSNGIGFGTIFPLADFILD